MDAKPSDESLMELALKAIEQLKEIESSPKWEEFSTSPCTMLRMNIEGQVASRGEIKVAMPIDELFAKLSIEENLQRINPQLKEIKVLHEIEVNGNKARVNYMRYVGIWPVQDRDLVNVAIALGGPDVCYIANKSCDFPYPEQDKVTRAVCRIGGYVLKKIDEKSTFVIYISEVNLAGSIPAMIQRKVSERQASLPSRIEKVLKA